jgi:HSP20 family molecular chaperone IbpA
MNSNLNNQITSSSTPIPFVPWEYGPQQNHQHSSAERREYNRRVAGAVRTLLHRQNRAYHRRIHQLQERWNQQHKEQMKLSQLAPTGFMENDEVMRLTVDLPGVSKDDIQIQIISSSVQYELHITAKRSYMSIDSTSCVSTNTKSQRYCINHNVVDVTKINATLHNGVLTIIAPKKKAISSTENSVTDMDTSKDNEMVKQNGGDITSPMTTDNDKDTAADSSAGEEKNNVNEIINIAVSEE